MLYHGYLKKCYWISVALPPTTDIVVSYLFRTLERESKKNVFFKAYCIALASGWVDKIKRIKLMWEV